MVCAHSGGNLLRGCLRSFSQRNPQSSLQRNWFGELAIIFSILTPLILNLFFRSCLAAVRCFAGELSSIWDPSVYYTIGRSHIEQFSLFLIFFLVGWLRLSIDTSGLLSVCFVHCSCLFHCFMHLTTRSTQDTGAAISSFYHVSLRGRAFS